MSFTYFVGGHWLDRVVIYSLINAAKAPSIGRASKRQAISTGSAYAFGLGMTDYVFELVRRNAVLLQMLDDFRRPNVKVEGHLNGPCFQF
jgi:hypothetical protein